MSYNAAYHRVLMSLDPCNRKQNILARSASQLEMKSQSALMDRPSRAEPLRRSKSIVLRSGKRQRPGPLYDPRSILLPAIMKAERDRMDDKRRRAATSSPAKDLENKENLARPETCAKPSPPSAVPTSRVQTSPDKKVVAKSPTKPKRPSLPTDAQMLALAEDTVAAIIVDLNALEKRQKMKRDALTDEAARASAETRDRTDNEEFVRSRLVEAETLLGEVEVAKFGSMWQRMKWEKNYKKKTISYLDWLTNKRAKLQEQRLREEKNRLEREAAESERKEKCRVAYEDWIQRTKNVPKPRPVIPLDGLPAHPPGTFYNPNPWVDILEEERQAKLAEEEAKATRLLQGSAPSTATFRPSQATKKHRQSTYDEVGAYYAGLLDKCRRAKESALAPRRARCVHNECAYEQVVEVKPSSVSPSSTRSAKMPQIHFRCRYEYECHISGVGRATQKRGKCFHK